MRLPSVMQHDFARVPTLSKPRSQFDRSRGYKTTFDAGYLIPFFLDEVLPGDTYNVRATLFARFNTPIHPIMDNLYLDTFFFFVPYRLLWTNWKKFNGEQANPGDSISYTTPQVPSTAGTGWTSGTLFDYFGLPTGLPGLSVSAFPSRAYNLIWNEWFRDQNLQSSVTVDTGDGPDTVANYVLLRRGKRHDYFTSCLTSLQKGTAVTIPMAGQAPITGIGLYTPAATAGSGAGNVKTTPNINSTMTGWFIEGNGGGAPTAGESLLFVEQSGTAGYPNIYANMSAVTSATINQFRQAIQVQALLELDARGGTRYFETVLNHWGVRVPDYTVQRPQYLGGTSTPLSIHPVPATTFTSGSNAQGSLAAFGTISSFSGFVQSFPEHGLIMGLCSVRADLTYFQGIHRSWKRSTRYDYYWPILDNLGEQSVLNQEIYAQATSADTDVFGYQERYAEYRYAPNLVTGLFRPAAAGSLDSWHLGINFGSLPAFNASFIVDDPPIDRVVAVTTEPDFYMDAYIKVLNARVMSTYGVPGLLPRF